MCDALRLAERQALPNHIIEQIHARTDKELETMIDKPSQHHRRRPATKRRREEDGVETEKPARRTRGTHRWSVDALRSYILDTHDADMDVT